MSERNNQSPEGEAPLIDDIDLSAYLDGEAGVDERRRIAEALDLSPGFARQASLLRDADQKARSYADALLATAPPARLCVRRMAAERRAKHARRVLAAGVILLAALIGFGSGWIGHGVFHQQSFIARTFVEDAEAAHRVFVVETRRPVEMSAAQGPELAAWLSKRLDLMVVPPDFSASGFRFIGGRLLPSRSRAPAAMLMYQNVDGLRVTFYVMKNPGAKPSSFRFFSSGEDGTESVYWFDREVSYGLTGAFDRDMLLTLAKDVLKAMDGA